MKRTFKLSLLALFLTNAMYAAQPIDGLYAGIMLGGSYVPSLKFTTPLLFGIPGTGIPGKLSYDGFGNIAGQVGFRFYENWRAEAELMYNSNTIKKLQIGSLVILSPKTSTTLRIKGKTTTTALMINGFYDFFTHGEDCNFSPYLGLGVGYAHTNTSLKFYYNNVYVTDSKYASSSNQPAGQVIVGAGYFMDDFTWVGLDYRYFTTKTIPALGSRMQINSINLTFNGTFCV